MNIFVNKHKKKKYRVWKKLPTDLQYRKVFMKKYVKTRIEMYKKRVISRKNRRIRAEKQIFTYKHYTKRESAVRRFNRYKLQHYNTRVDCDYLLGRIIFSFTHSCLSLFESAFKIVYRLFYLCVDFFVQTLRTFFFRWKTLSKGCRYLLNFLEFIITYVIKVIKQYFNKILAFMYELFMSVPLTRKFIKIFESFHLPFSRYFWKALSGYYFYILFKLHTRYDFIVNFEIINPIERAISWDNFWMLIYNSYSGFWGFASWFWTKYTFGCCISFCLFAAYVAYCNFVDYEYEYYLHFRKRIITGGLIFLLFIFLSVVYKKQILLFFISKFLIIFLLVKRIKLYKILVVIFLSLFLFFFADLTTINYVKEVFPAEDFRDYLIFLGVTSAGFSIYFYRKFGIFKFSLIFLGFNVFLFSLFNILVIVIFTIIYYYTMQDKKKKDDQILTLDEELALLKKAEEEKNN